MKIVTGYTGESHVTSTDDRHLHAGTFGKGCYILDVGDRFNCEQDTGNRLIVHSGDCVINGTHARIEEQEYVTVPNGSVGMMRRDVVCARYTRTGQVESVDLVVLSGDADVSNPQLPYMYTNDNGFNVLDGNTIVDFPLWEVDLDGVNITQIIELNTTDETLAHSLHSITQEIWSYVYPVGSIYMTTENINPANVFGGAWERFSQGRFLVGQGTGTDINETSVTFSIGGRGGAYTIPLETPHLPAHSHEMANVIESITTSSKLIGVNPSSSTTETVITDVRYREGVSYTGETGQGLKHGNTPPYEVVYIWRRIA